MKLIKTKSKLNLSMTLIGSGFNEQKPVL